MAFLLAAILFVGFTGKPTTESERIPVAGG
jgi:hypothetical protein